MEEKVEMDEKDAVESLGGPEPSEAPEPSELPEPPHSIFPKWQRVVYVYIASVAAFASPVSSSIYYPAMLTLAKDLNTSLTKISLTITTFMVYIIPIVILSRNLYCQDIPRHCSHHHRRNVRPIWSSASLFSLIYVDDWGQYWARIANKLRRVACFALLAKLW